MMDSVACSPKQYKTRRKMVSIPSPESSGEIILDWLHEEGWTVVHSQRNDEWIIEATKGDRRVESSGTTLEEAWFRAIKQGSQ
ncbi:MAG: hypothetical protein QM775_28440 [Pirellulales bacterium]